MNIRLLVVEDDEQVAKYVVRVLSNQRDSVSFDCTVVGTASDCESALAKKPARYDEVLLDLNLPNGKGVATFLRIYTMTSQLRIPIVVMTADQFIRDSEVVRKGAQDFLAKPLPADEIVIERLHFAVLRYESRREVMDKFRTVLAGIKNMIDKCDDFPT